MVHKGVFMDLLDRMKGLGHYAKKVVKTVTKPLNTLIATATILTVMNSVELKAQNNPSDTIYATGIFTTTDSETGDNIEGVTLTARSDIDPNSVYTFITDNDGWAVFDDPGLPVHIITGIDEYNNKDEASVQRTFGADLITAFSNSEKGRIEIYNLSGQRVLGKDFHTDHEYLDLSNLSATMYVYRIQTESGIVLTGKYLKQNVAPKGKTEKNPSVFKSTQTYSADYWVKWEHPDYYTDSLLVTLFEGGGNFINLFPVSNITPIPQHQDLTGIAKMSTDEGYGPLSNMTAVLYNETTNETFQVNMGSDGAFTFNDVPAGSVCYVSVGGDDGRIAFNDIDYTVPSVISSMNDTIADFFSTVHGLKLATSTVQHLVQHTLNGTQSQERKYYYDTSVSSSEKTVYESWFSQLENMSNDYTYTEVSSQSEANIKIIDGTYNTGTDVEEVITPLKTYYPVYFATTSLNTAGDFGDFCHEIYQANGKTQVAWGILGPNPSPTGPTQEDLDIAKLEMDYWVYAVYTDQETYVDLNYAAETLESKSPMYKGMIFKSGEWVPKEETKADNLNVEFN